MKHSLAVFIVCAFCTAPPVLAIDCLEAPDLAREIAGQRDRDPAGGVAEAERILPVVDEASCPRGAGMLLWARASNLHILGRSDEALDDVRRALLLLAATSQAVDQDFAAVHLTAGVLHWQMEAFDQALSHYLDALAFSQSAGDARGAARAAGNIGNLYNSLGNLDQSIEYHREALAAFQNADDLLGQAGTNVNLAAVSLRLGEVRRDEGDHITARQHFEAMLDYAESALTLFEALENPRGRAYAASNIAAALVALERPQEALAHHQAILELQRQVGDVGGEFQASINLADNHLQLDDMEAALAALDAAEALVPVGNAGQRLEIEQRRVAFAERQGDYRSALEHQKEITLIRRQIAADQMAARVEEIRLAMRAEQREQEVELLRGEALIAELRIARQRVTMVAAIVTALLFLVLLLVLWNRYQVRIRASRKLDQAARTDQLTGLSNRRDMMERLELAHAQCRRDDRIHSLIMADIDDFKQLNDRHGHAFGDTVLKYVSDTLRAAVKGQDVVARWGGEEFLILLPRTRLEDARRVADYIRDALKLTPPDELLPVLPTLTLGVAELTAQTPVDEAIRRADDAMYQGKQSGKDRQTAYRPET